MIAPGVPFDDIGEGHLQQLIDAESRERLTVEYKKELPSGRDDDVKEFLTDVSSFANAGGGDLVFGMKAEDGVPVEVVPLDFEPDAEKLRWEARARDGIQPRIPGVRLREIDVGGGRVLVIRVPRSWAGPHAVTYKSSGFRFFSRTSAGKYPLDISELRSAFVSTAGVGDRIRDFRTERLGRIVANEGPLPLHPRPKIVLHLLPIGALTAPATHDLNAVRGSGLFQPALNVVSDNERWNIDGLLTYARDSDDIALAYSQLFRSGILETVDAYYLIERDATHYKPPWASANDVEERLIKSIANSIEVLNRVGVPTPVVALASLVGVRGFALVSRHDSDNLRYGRRIDRDVVLLPDVVIDEYEANRPRALRPIAEALWQASGWNGTPNYDAEGNWTPPPVGA